MKERRQFLRSQWETLKDTKTPQKQGIPQPDAQKATADCQDFIELVAPEALSLGEMPLKDVIERRRSRRHFSADPLTIEELSFLLWATQGVREVMPNELTKRTVPSGGSRHPFETYLSVHRVVDLAPGLYRYDALKHRLCLQQRGDFAEKATDACMGQAFVRQSALTFFWTAIPFRSEWRYDHQSHKVIALDAGHVCQNLYLAAESIGCGACAIGAYSQGKSDMLLGVDGEDEFVIYIAPVGRLE